MANEITSSSTSTDQEKFLNSQLLDRSHIMLVMASLMDKVQMKEGAGLVAYFVRYKRMNVPVAPISEGVDPSNSSFTLEQVTVTLDQWGDLITITDRAKLTTKHPLVQQCIELLADNAARVMDREIQVVMMAGTNVQYADGSVTSRSALTSAHRLNEDVIIKARTTMVRNGAPPRGDPSRDAKAGAATGNFTKSKNYVAVCGPGPIGDLQRPGGAMGSWAAVATYQNARALYNSEVGTWMNVRFVESNFVPEFTMLGNTTVAIADTGSGGITGLTVTESNAAGTMSGVVYLKFTRKDLLRGFEEAISIRHSFTLSGANDTLTIAMPSTTGYVYNIYTGTVDADASLNLAVENAAASSSNVILTAVATGATAPANLNAADDTVTAIHPIFVFAEKAMAWVGFYQSEVMLSKDEATTHNPLKLRRTIAYKYFGKAVLKDTTRLLRIEVASYFV